MTACAVRRSTALPHSGDVPAGAPPQGRGETVPWDAWTWDGVAGRGASAVVGVGALCAALALGGGLRGSFWTGLVAPDAVLVARVLRSRWDGELHSDLSPEDVAAYNRAHAVQGPVALIGLGVASMSHTALVGGLGWLAHVGVDRAFGYGKRRADGSIFSRRPPEEGRGGRRWGS